MTESNKPAGYLQSGLLNVIVEIKVPGNVDVTQVRQLTTSLPGFTLASHSDPILMRPPVERAGELARTGEQIYLLAGTVIADELSTLKQHPDVIKVSLDAPIAPFA